MRRIELALRMGSFAVVMAVLFQNCGAPLKQNVSASRVKTDTEFFAYPYSAKPSFYSSISLYKAAGSQASLHNFTFVGSAAQSDPASTLPLQYVVTFQDEAGHTVCPEATGTLNQGFSTIQYNCVSSLNPTSVHVKMTMTAGSVSGITEQVF